MNRLLPAALLGILVVQPVGLHPARAGEAEVKVKLAALKEAVKASADSPEVGDAKANPAALVAMLDMGVQMGDYDQMMETLRSGIAFAGKNDKVLGAVQELMSVLPPAALERRQKIQKEIDAVLEEQGIKLLAAKAPKDVDPVLRALQTAQTTLATASYRRYSNDLGGLDAATRVTALWQDYLRLVQGGQHKDAANQLRQIMDQVIRIPQFITRSTVGERMDALSFKDSSSVEPTVNAAEQASIKARELVAAATSIDALPKLQAELEALPLPQRERNYDGLLGRVTQLNQARTALAIRDVDATLGHLQRNPLNWDNPQLDQLRRNLLLQALPLYLEKPTFVPRADETLTSALDRMIDESVEKNEWSAVYRGLHAYRVFLSNNGGNQRPAGLTDDISAVSNLISGYNNERAGQWTAAVRFYLSALKSAREVDVVTFIKPRLQAIERDHAEAYLAGQTPEIRTQYVPGAPYSFQGRPGQPMPSAEEKPASLPPGPLSNPTATVPVESKK